MGGTTAKIRLSVEDFLLEGWLTVDTMSGYRCTQMDYFYVEMYVHT